MAIWITSLPGPPCWNVLECVSPASIGLAGLSVLGIGTYWQACWAELDPDQATQNAIRLISAAKVTPGEAR